MDWHHPDGMRSQTDPAARQRFVDYIHGQIRELLTNYGKIDVLWYDVACPLDAEGWQSEKMNKMVLELQPDIIVNNRNWLKGDFSTPEQSIEATKGDWESCMTLNDSWATLPRTITGNRRSVWCATWWSALKAAAITCSISVQSRTVPYRSRVSRS